MSASSTSTAAARARVVTGIVAAMPEEMAALRGRLTDARRLGGGGRGTEIVSGRLGEAPVVLAVTGDGEHNARCGIAALLATVSLDRILAIGVAGALSRDLDAGALVVSERVVSDDGARAFTADGPLCACAVRRTTARRGLVVTAARIVDTVAEKQRLLAASRAGGLPAVVDLESVAYAAAATRAAIPFIIMRAVSDTADEALPALLNRCRDPGGAVRRARVALELLGEPSALPVLLSLRQRVRIGAEALARATEALLLDAERDAPSAAPSGSAPDEAASTAPPVPPRTARSARGAI